MKAVRRSRTSFWINVVLKNFSLQRNFQGLLSIVQLSRFFLCSVSSDSFYILSKALSFVKNFFIFLLTAQATALIDYHIAVRLSTTFFHFLFFASAFSDKFFRCLSLSVFSSFHSLAVPPPRLQKSVSVF